jgi:thymidylate synthase
VKKYEVLEPWQSSGYVAQHITDDCAFIREDTIEAAWREAIRVCVKRGYDYIVESGSYVGQIRRQLEHVTVVIEQPGTRPLAPLMPPGIPAPTSDDSITQYFVEYLMGNEVKPDENYTYGQFITRQIDNIIEKLNKSHGNTNQATITIGDADSVNLPHPPCLKVIDFKVVAGKLNMSVFFRSWDLFVGLPENLGGLQLLKEYVLGHLEFPCVDGSIISYSDGLHIYEQYFDKIYRYVVIMIGNQMEAEDLTQQSMLIISVSTFSSGLGIEATLLVAYYRVGLVPRL